VTAGAFVHPEWLAPALCLWLALAAATGGAVLRARRRGRRLIGAPLAGGAGGRDALLLLALAAALLALLGPRLGTRSERLPATGVDVVVLVDVSRSMDARDVPPSRLDRALRAADELLARLAPGDRAALAAFAGRGVLLAPLTPDHGALRELLPALDTSLVRPAASRLGAGVREALAAFDAGSARPRVLVVLSDGEDPDGADALPVAELLRAGTRVVSVAFGSEAGATVPSEGLELRDRRGRLVTTRRDAERLARLARETSGDALFPDAFGALDGATLAAAVRRDADRGEAAGAQGEGEAAGAPGEDEAGWRGRRVPAVRVAPLALLALLLLVIEAAPRGRARRALAVAGLGLLALGAGGSEPYDARALLHRGLAYAEAGRWDEAELAFRGAALLAREPALGALAYYDAGVAALESGRLEDARDAFLESLALVPDPRARFNLEWTVRRLALPPPEPPPARAEAEPESDEQAERPEPAPEAPPAPRPEAMPEPAPQAQPPAAGREDDAPPPLSPQEVERWLARAGDDPALALRALAGPGESAREGSPW
jgi:Ca-activated chloride channel family protein